MYRIFSIDDRICIVIYDIRYTIYEIRYFRISYTQLWPITLHERIKNSRVVTKSMLKLFFYIYKYALNWVQLQLSSGVPKAEVVKIEQAEAVPAVDAILRRTRTNAPDAELFKAATPARRHKTPGRRLEEVELPSWDCNCMLNHKLLLITPY